MPSLRFCQSQYGKEIREEGRKGDHFTLVSAGSQGYPPHSAKQWSVLKHSDKKLNYFLIEFML